MLILEEMHKTGSSRGDIGSKTTSDNVNTDIS